MLNETNNGAEVNNFSAKEPNGKARAYIPVKPLRKGPMIDNFPDLSSSTAKDPKAYDPDHDFDLVLAGECEKRTIESMSR
jgi:hypothetical protein